MFECRACVLRWIRAIASDAFKTPSLPRRQLPISSRLPNRAFQRTISNGPRRPQTHQNGGANGLVEGQQPLEEQAKSDPRDDTSARPKALVIPDEKHLKMELKYLTDPVKHAEHIHYTLRQNKPEKALNLCRLSSKTQQVIVSWNHCVDWHMRQNKIDAAIKIYNEMKKRAQFPDSYTYVLLLRGLSKGHHHGQAVKESNVVKAMSIYNSMGSPTSRVKPGIFHTNAVLRVCSAALDMDALWGIASKLPEKGAGSPDHMTYTILLNAIRYGAFGKNPESVYAEQIARRRHQAVQEGRKVWMEVITKWRAGIVQIDEDLVCAMGRLLLISQRMRDWDDVLELVQQTMKIERLIPPLGHKGRNVEHVPLEDTNELPDPEAEDVEGYKDAPSTKAFHTITPMPPDSAHPDRPTALVWVQPGNPTLSLLIDACTLLRTPKTATAYWELLTAEPYNLKPDIANFHAQLKLLGKNRSSVKAVALLKTMQDAGVEPKNQTFRIAMSICQRDQLNHHALSNARAVVDVMEKTCVDMDVHTLGQYLSLAVTTDDGTKIVDAVNRLDPIVHNLKSRVTYGTDTYGKDRRTGSEDDGWRAPEAHIRDKEEIIKFFQSLIGVIDTLMHRGLVPRESFQSWHARRSQLNTFVGKAKKNVERTREKVGMGAAPAEVWEREKVRAEEVKTGVVRAPARMSKAEWAAKVFKSKGRRERAREENRQKAVGRWWIGGKERRRIQLGRGPGGEDDGPYGEPGGGFADSALELSAR